MFSLTVQNKYGEQLELTHNAAYAITEIDGIDPPDAVINTTKNAGADGSVFNSAYVNDRQITITLVVNAPAEVNRLNLYRYFKTKFPVRLYYSNKSRNVYIDGYVQNITVGYFEQKQTVQIVIFCPRPQFNGVNESVQEFATVESLFEFPFEVPLSENLLPYPYDYGTRTNKGITYTDNGDGTITANGTATAYSDFPMHLRTDETTPYYLPDGTYTVSGCPSGGGASTYRILVGITVNNTWQTIAADAGDGATFNYDSSMGALGVVIAVYSGATVNNVLFKPMINVGNSVIEYAPYVAPGIEFSSISIYAEKSIINNGDVDIGVIITIQARGMVETPKIYNVDTGESFILNINLQEGDLITINTKRGEKSVTLTRNGVTTGIVGSLADGSSWFQLVPGDNVFTIAADSLAENMVVTFIIVDQYEGV